MSNAIRVHHVCSNVNNFGFVGKYRVGQENEFCHETKTSCRRRKSQTLHHRMKIDEEKKKNIVKFNDVCAKEYYKASFLIFPIISNKSCFSYSYRKNNYVRNSLGKRTIFVEKSENVNIKMRARHILYRVSKYFVKKEKKRIKKNYANVCLFHEICKEIFLQSRNVKKV